LEYIKSVTVSGLRGVSGELPLHLAIPDGRPGSGLTILVGANNSGKSTVVEAFEALARSKGNLPSFSVGKRNAHNPNHLNISCSFVGDELRQNWLELIYGGSETHWLHRDIDIVDISVVPSRRGFEPYFGRSGPTERQWYYSQRAASRFRPQALQDFEGRLFKIHSADDRGRFNHMLGNVMGKVPQWTIDQTDTGQYFLKFHLKAPQFYHSSEGVGDGIVSLFVIVSALYDSQPQSVIVIDEPELSLHPHYQRRLRSVLSELSADRQIVCATHSPYFVNWRDIENGAEVTRAYKSTEYNIRHPASACFSRGAGRNAVS
jgi:predicted ATPase